MVHSLLTAELAKLYVGADLPDINLDLSVGNLAKTAYETGLKL